LNKLVRSSYCKWSISWRNHSPLITKDASRTFHPIVSVVHLPSIQNMKDRRSLRCPTISMRYRRVKTWILNTPSIQPLQYAPATSGRQDIYANIYTMCSRAENRTQLQLTLMTLAYWCTVLLLVLLLFNFWESSFLWKGRE